MKRFVLPIIALSLLVSCGTKPRQTQDTEKNDRPSVVVPRFNADSAFSFVEAQTKFGPRVPETDAHRACAEWLATKLARYADTVVVQDFRARIYDGQVKDGKNIIATFNPDAKKRILLCAHWDSRPFADHDADKANWGSPIDGANDGASGVGVLIECARLFKQQPLHEKLGIDIVFFDLEDYGPRQDQTERYYSETANHWALGSQYWAKNPHVYGYKAYYGILLDMVGGAEPTFMKEYYSMQYANWIMEKVWGKALELGHRNCFVSELGDPISDDHLPLIAAGIPTIDIIDLKPESSNGSFSEVWHTKNDNIDNIDKKTLGIVGEVVVNTIYNE